MSDAVARAKAALEGVTEGPWEQNGNNGVHTPNGECVATTARHQLLPDGKPVRKADAEFIVAARSLVPELVAELQDLRLRLTAFGQDCVTHGDMTPTAQRMLDKILTLDWTPYSAARDLGAEGREENQ